MNQKHSFNTFDLTLTNLRLYWGFSLISLGVFTGNILINFVGSYFMQDSPDTIAPSALWILISLISSAAVMLPLYLQFPRLNFLAGASRKQVKTALRLTSLFFVLISFVVWGLILSFESWDSSMNLVWSLKGILLVMFGFMLVEQGAWAIAALFFKSASTYKSSLAMIVFTVFAGSSFACLFGAIILEVTQSSFPIQNYILILPAIFTVFAYVVSRNNPLQK